MVINLVALDTDRCACSTTITVAPRTGHTGCSVLYLRPDRLRQIEMASCQPASLTKHLPLIHHPLPRQCLPAGAEQDESILRLKQISSSNSDSRNDTDSSQEKGAGSTGTTGTTLWLGGQLMSCYMAETLPAGSAMESGRRRHKRVLELGGGIGFLS